eukprot:g60363.t1
MLPAKRSAALAYSVHRLAVLKQIWIRSSSTYKPHEVEGKWQERWRAEAASRTGKASELLLSSEKKEKKYILSMFPYPSGELHMGHVRVYTLSDTLARLYRLQGYQVVHPMGWDAFGLPAENAALERGVDPARWTQQNIAAMKQQLLQLGMDFDWELELSTCQPEYYRWTQWIFLQLFKQGLAYQRAASVNWDPVDETVLANEQVDAQGRSWRSGALVEKKLLHQWFLDIRSLAPELLQALDDLNEWPSAVKHLQRSWIGHSQGAKVSFSVEEQPGRCLEVFTSRPETLYGVSFLALAPEHPGLRPPTANNATGALRALMRPQCVRQLEKLQQRLASHTDVQRQTSEAEAGLNTGLTARHPLLPNVTLPIFVAAYVLPQYGTGAVMGVPGHDTRDRAFAKQNGLRVLVVMEPVDQQHTHEAPGKAADQHTSPAPDKAADQPEEESCFTGEGVMVNSGEVTGLTSQEARAQVVSMLEAAGRGESQQEFRLQNWLVSRQRYWGAPVPVLHCREEPSCGPQPVPEHQLPVTLPDLMSGLESTTDRKRALRSEQARAWREGAACPRCGGKAERDTDTLDTFVDSSWYFLRFLCPPQARAQKAWDPVQAGRWLPVDVYVGGVEHAILHLLYARFITRALHKQGLVTEKEPFKCLLSQGMVLGATYRWKDSQRPLPAKDVTPALLPQLYKVYEKMSKSKGNGVAPQEAIEQYGADVCRIAMLFKAPPEKNLEWGPEALAGPSRWLQRLWALLQDYLQAHQDRPAQLSPPPQDPQQWSPTEQALSLARAEAVLGVTRSMETHLFNVAVAQLMTLSNSLKELASQDHKLLHSPVYSRTLETLIIMLAPMAPHISAELWTQLQQAAEDKRGSGSNELQRQSWPQVSRAEHALQEAAARKVKVLVSFKGKKIDLMEFDSAIAQDKETLTAAVLQTKVAQDALCSQKPSRVVVVYNEKTKSYIVNLVP